MVQGERSSLGTAESILTQSGFTVSALCCSRPSCFDFAARKNENLVFIKKQRDISSLSPHDMQELKFISEDFSAASLLIGEQSREKPLEDDTVYTRYGVVAVTSKTFENILLRGALPLIQTSPGGYYVEIDPQALKRRRQKLGLSVGEVADIVGISRRTIYGYERGMAKASVPAAYKMIWALGIPVARQVNIFERSREPRRACLLATAKRVFSKNKLLQRIMGKFAKCHITTVERAPFDFVIVVSDNRRIVGGVANPKEPELNRRVDEILSVSKIMNAHPVLITEDACSREKDILCISSKEVAHMNGPEDLIAKVT
jgi:putative transcriptional regulator